MQSTKFKAVEDTASKLVYTPQLDNATPENTEKGRALEAIANLKQFFKKEEPAETNHSTASLPIRNSSTIVNYFYPFLRIQLILA